MDKHNFISHSVVESWGSIIYIMEKDGKSFCSVYWYNDDPSTIFISNLSVNPENRNQGLATELQEMCEEMGRDFGYTISCLWVNKNTWVHDWYERRGYEDHIPHEDDIENLIWMRKSLV